GADLPHNVYVAVVDFARPRVPVVYMMGNVYQDANQDGFWEAVEGMVGVNILLHEAACSAGGSVVSRELGAYQVAVPRIYFSLGLYDGLEVLLQQRFFNGISFGRRENSLVDFKIIR
ncbi:hypothetical protein DRJ25_05185, partial [Candidatus Woesearchaeota archaeon]